MGRNKILINAKVNKKDEFFTSYEDIAKEMCYYTKHFKGKSILCNCNDSIDSNFWKYFRDNFEQFGLIKLTCISYDPNGHGVVTEMVSSDAPPCMTMIASNGDFRSTDCIEYIKSHDIVITNCPWSLFREYMDVLFSYEKKFIVMGSINAITYKNFFPYIAENKVWLGASVHSGDREFKVPDWYPVNTTNCRITSDGKKYIRVTGVRWWTNLDHGHYPSKFMFNNSHNFSEFDRYDNFDAINVDKVADIPDDYYGVIGVPITFLDKYNNEDFSIVGITKAFCDNYRTKRYTINDFENYSQLNTAACINESGTVIMKFARLLIMRNGVFD